MRLFPDFAIINNAVLNISVQILFLLSDFASVWFYGTGEALTGPKSGAVAPRWIIYHLADVTHQCSELQLIQ